MSKKLAFRKQKAEEYVREDTVTTSVAFKIIGYIAMLIAFLGIMIDRKSVV